MRIFLSAEHEHQASDGYQNAWKYVEERLSFVCEKNVGLEEDDTYGTEFQDVGIITIIIPKQMKEYWKENT